MDDIRQFYAGDRAKLVAMCPKKLLLNIFACKPFKGRQSIPDVENHVLFSLHFTSVLHFVFVYCIKLQLNTLEFEVTM